MNLYTYDWPSKLRYGCWDKDGFAGTQCADFATHPSKYFSCGICKQCSWFARLQKLLAGKHTGMPTDANPRAGAFFNMNAWFGGVNYGHCGIVIEDSDGITMNRWAECWWQCWCSNCGGPADYTIEVWGCDWLVLSTYSDGAAPVTPANVTPTSEEIELTPETGTFKVGRSSYQCAVNQILTVKSCMLYEAGDSVNYDTLQVVK